MSLSGKRLIALSGLLLLALSGSALAQDRELLCSIAPSDDLKQVVAKIRDYDQPKVPYAALTKTTKYYVRLVPRKNVVTAGNELRDDAILGTKPVVFITTPEGIYGKSLLEVYLDIGYEAEDIVRWQRDQEMVAVVLRYPREIEASDVRDGRIPDDWAKKVFVPSWDNVFAVFQKLAADAAIDPEKKGEFAPWKLFFRTTAERDFVLSYPDEGKARLKSVDYATLRGTGGADWSYRSILERKLSIFEHFRGDGRTINELTDPFGQQKEAGLHEFIGPNTKLKDLPELAVVSLGAVIIQDTHRKR